MVKILTNKIGGGGSNTRTQNIESLCVGGGSGDITIS